MDVDLLLKIPLFTRGRWGSPSTPFRENTAIPLKMYTFSRSHREKKMFVCSFITMNAPFKSTLGNWEVMCSILPHDIMNHHDFCWKIRISDLRSGCNKFYSSPGSNSLDGCWPLIRLKMLPLSAFRPRGKCVRLPFYYNDCPLQKHPWQLGGHVFNSCSWHNETPRFLLNWLSGWKYCDTF